MNLEDQLDFTEPVQPKAEKKDDFMLAVFEFLNSITVTKDNLIHTEQDVKRYQKARFMVLRALSFYQELIPIVNLVNVKAMDPRQEYDLLRHVVPKKVRRDKWLKKSPKSVFLRSVQEYYGYNENKASEVMKILSIDHLAAIETRIRKEDSWTFSGGSASK